jgi:hypothetical protein
MWFDVVFDADSEYDAGFALKPSNYWKFAKYRHISLSFF